MVKSKKSKFDGLTIAIVVVLSFIIIAFLVAGFGSLVSIGSGDTSQKFKIDCVGEIQNPFARHSRFSSASCNVKEARFCSFGQKFSLLSDEGELVLELGSSRSTKSWKCGEGDSCSFDISMCGVPKSTSGELKLLGNNGEILDRRNVGV